MSRRRATLLAAVIVVLVPGQTDAQALYAEARLRGDTVTVEVFFADNTPAHAVAVSVRDPAGRELAAGRTDDRGAWSFTRPLAGKYEIVADDGAGQRISVALTIPRDAVLKTLSPAPDEIVVTGGPGREELTRFPWLRGALALAAIGGVAALLWLANRGARCRGRGC